MQIRHYWRRGWDPLLCWDTLRSSTARRESGRYTWSGWNTSSSQTVFQTKKKRAVLLSVVGATTYKILRNILAPSKPGDKSYETLVDALAKHYKPAPYEIVERFKFHNRSRKQGESVSTYVAELRAMTEFCNFGETLEVMIRDRLVCGINDINIQRRLLSEPKLTYAKAVEIAQTAESAAQSMRELRSKHGASPLPIHTPDGVNRMSDVKTTPTCYRCGAPGHVVPDCPLPKEVVCHNCGKKAM